MNLPPSALLVVACGCLLLDWVLFGGAGCALLLFLFEVAKFYLE